jgi:hypothetical protein
MDYHTIYTEIAREKEIKLERNKNFPANICPIIANYCMVTAGNYLPNLLLWILVNMEIPTCCRGAVCKEVSHDESLVKLV